MQLGVATKTSKIISSSLDRFQILSTNIFVEGLLRRFSKFQHLVVSTPQVALAKGESQRLGLEVLSAAAIFFFSAIGSFDARFATNLQIPALATSVGSSTKQPNEIHSKGLNELLVFRGKGVMTLYNVRRAMLMKPMQGNCR